MRCDAARPCSARGGSWRSTQALIDGFGDAPVGLGKSFGIQEHVGGTFVDAVIRANVSFQLSRLPPMLRAATSAAGSTPRATTPSCSGTGGWHPAGVRPPEPGAVKENWHKGRVAPVVALVGRGRHREVSAAGKQVRGVVLARDLPHLSHLAIRARQEQVPLATTEDEETRNYARYLVGQWVFFHVTPEGVILAPATDAQIAAYEADAARTQGEPPTAAPAAPAPEPAPETKAEADSVDDVAWEKNAKKKGKGKKGKGQKEKVKETPTPEPKVAETKVTAQGTVQFSDKLECRPGRRHQGDGRR